LIGEFVPFTTLRVEKEVELPDLVRGLGTFAQLLSLNKATELRKLTKKQLLKLFHVFTISSVVKTTIAILTTNLKLHRKS
jgi:hypothetical protein